MVKIQCNTSISINLSTLITLEWLVLRFTFKMSSICQNQLAASVRHENHLFLLMTIPILTIIL